MVAALERVETIRKLEIGQLKLERIPPSRLKMLARYAAGARVQTLERLTPQRRTATLVAFIKGLETTAQDDVLDLLEQLTRSLLARVQSP